MSETRVRRRTASRASIDLGQLISRFVADMVAAIKVRDVLIGLAGTILLALGSLTPAYLPQSSPYWEPARALGLDSEWAKALGNQLTSDKIKQINALEPLPYDPPEPEVPEVAEIHASELEDDGEPPAMDDDGQTALF